MSLTSGTKLGPYEIRSSLGAGGMGEVYRARDTRLDRDVAVKVLPADVASDPSLKQRLEREAKAVSKLSHPHICTLHDIGQHDGTDYIVMELLEGETLEQRLGKGPLPSEQVLRFASQIADALAKAHKLGITHRDLKPANIMLTKAGAKLMDFGLAKQCAAAPLAQALTEMTMAQAKLTEEGTIIGTLQYMAPEQLEGKQTDPRTDIFALGEVIYEMATGKAAFAGSSKASLIAAILTTDPPPMSQLQPLTPPALERVVQRCLAKDPDERWQSASDLASELKWIAEGGAATAPRQTQPLSRWARMSGLVAIGAVILALVFGLAWWKAQNHHLPATYFNAPIPFAANDVALSPDGRLLAMVAYSPQMNNYGLWTYELGTRRNTMLQGTEGARYPFWSPDGKNIGFFADGKLKKVDVSYGQVQIICDAPNGRGGAWNREGTIIFAPNALGPLMRVSSWGGSPTELTQLDLSRSEAGHRWPVFLPDGKRFLFLAANFSSKPGINAIFLASLDSPERHLLVHTKANAFYAEPGYLLYMRDKVLVAQPLDLRKFALTGEPRTLSDEVLYFSQVFRAVFSVSGSVLVIQTGKGVYPSQLTWFDRSGKAGGSVGSPAWHDNVQISPDGQRIATDETDPDTRNTDVYVHDPVRGSKTRLTFDPALDLTPVWSPDGRRIVFSSNRSNFFHLYRKNSDGSGSDEDIGGSEITELNPMDWSRDGRYLVVRRSNGLSSFDFQDRSFKPLIQGNYVVRGAQFSPDGRWVAYGSNESGRMEIYVTNFPSGNGKWQVSNGGGLEPRWRRDGKELYFLSTDGTLMATSIAASAGFEAGTPKALFKVQRRLPISSQDIFSYDVTADGRRFLVAKRMDEASFAPLSVVMNWAAELEK